MIETQEKFDCPTEGERLAKLQRILDEVGAAYVSHDFALREERAISAKLRASILEICEAVGVLKGAKGVVNHVRRIAAKALEESKPKQS